MAAENELKAFKCETKEVSRIATNSLAAANEELVKLEEEKVTAEQTLNETLNKIEEMQGRLSSAKKELHKKEEQLLLSVQRGRCQISAYKEK